MDFVSKHAQSNPSQNDQPNNPGFLSSANVVAGAAQSQLRREDYDKAKAAGAGADLLEAASEYGKLDETQGVGKYVGQGEDYLRNYSNADAPGTKIPDSDDSVPAKTLAGDKDSSDLKTGPDAGEDYSDIKSTGADGVVKSISGDDYGGLKASADDVKGEIPVGGEKIESEETADGGLGESVKKAEGFLSKTGGEAEGEETELGKVDDGEKKSEAASETQSGGGGFGSSVMKMAGGFLKK